VLENRHQPQIQITDLLRNVILKYKISKILKEVTKLSKILT